MESRLYSEAPPPGQGGEVLAVAVDFDGTLVENGYPSIGEERDPGNLELLRTLQRNGVCIIVNTCRVGGPRHNMLSWLARQDFWPSLTNQNHPTLVEKYGDCRKITASVYIDDKALYNLRPDWWRDLQGWFQANKLNEYLKGFTYE